MENKINGKYKKDHKIYVQLGKNCLIIYAIWFLEREQKENVANTRLQNLLLIIFNAASTNSGYLINQPTASKHKK